jgi:hypothetical protein
MELGDMEKPIVNLGDRVPFDGVDRHDRCGPHNGRGSTEESAEASDQSASGGLFDCHEAEYLIWGDMSTADAAG